jgi:hypothetical protein
MTTRNNAVRKANKVTRSANIDCWEADYLTGHGRKRYAKRCSARAVRRAGKAICNNVN